MKYSNYKEITKETYEKHAKTFAALTSHYPTSPVKENLEFFLNNLCGTKIIDVGCGPGNYLEYFERKGYTTVGVDISKSMVSLCKDKGLSAYEMDFENLNFPNNSFDGAVAITSLLHVPKSKFPKTICEITNILVENGLLYIAMKEGDFDGFKKREPYDNMEQYFSFYRQEELREILKRNFDILHFRRIKSTKTNQDILHFICEKHRKLY